MVTGVGGGGPQLLPGHDPSGRGKPRAGDARRREQQHAAPVRLLLGGVRRRLRPRGRGWSFGQRLRHQAVADAGNGLQSERPRARRQLTHLADHEVYGVLADDPAVPALGDQVVAADHLASGERQGDQHLHDTRLQHLAAASPHHFACGWSHLKPAD
jgi:hypothetical protein